MMPYLNIFGAAIAFPPLIILVGAWLGTNLAEKHVRKHGLTSDQLYNLVFIGLVGFVLGGRLGFAAQHPAAFIENPISLISRNFGLFDPLSGAVVGLIATAIYLQRQKLKLWPVLDVLTPALAVAMLAVPLANLASGNAFGAESDLPWAIELWGATRHPVQVYEAVGAAVILWAVWPTRKTQPQTPGAAFLQFAAYTAFARLIFEAFRGSSQVLFLDIRIMQLAAWAVLAAALWGLYQLKTKPHGKKAVS